MPLSFNSNRLITERLARFGFKSYTEYLSSERWQEKRRQWYADRSGRPRCYCCGKWDVPLQLHHKTYKRLCLERLNDLISLCDACHKGCHALLDSGKADIFTCAKLYRKAYRKSLPTYVPHC